MNRYLLSIAYIGTRFRGMQKTVNKADETALDTTTVQSSIEIALAKFKPLNKIDVVVSSRTDAGVHALCSTVHVDLQRYDSTPYPVDKITQVLNKQFYKQDLAIRVIDTKLVPDTFHCRYNAKARTYLYRFAVAKTNLPTDTKLKYLTFKTYIPIEEVERCFFIQDDRFDINILRETSNLFLGRHDFRTFMGVSGQNKERHANFAIRSINDITISPAWPVTSSFEYEKANSLYNYWDLKITAKSFLYKQVRRTVAVLLAAATGRLTQKEVYEMITIPSKWSWCSHVNVLPPFALYLCNIHYNEEDLKFKSTD